MMIGTSRVLRHAGVAAAACAAVLFPAVAAVASPAGPGLGPHAATAPAPIGYYANSISWINPQHGWVLGGVHCSKPTSKAPAIPCADVIGTSNGGKSWHQIARIKDNITLTYGPTPKPGISEIVMQTAAVGWAYGPQLYRTVNGGTAWTKQALPGNGKQILSLVANSQHAYALVSPCPWMQGICTRSRPLTLWRTSGLTGPWKKVPVNLPINVTGNLAISGRTVYVADPWIDFRQHDLLYASANGISFARRPTPCDNRQFFAITSIAASSAKNLAVLCEGNPGFSKSVKTVYVSANLGKTWKNAGTLGPYGIQAQIAASPTGNLAVASWSDGSFMYVKGPRGTAWKMSYGLGDGGAGWDDITFVSGSELWIVYSPVDQAPGYGQLYVSHNAGRKLVHVPV